MARGRPRIDVDVDVNNRGVAGWFQNQLYNTSLVWLIGLLVAGVAFWSSTTSRLESGDKRFDSVETTMREQRVYFEKSFGEIKSALSETKRTESTEREKVRGEFLADSKATAAGMAELNKQTAVMGSVLGQVKDELVKLNQRMDAPQIKLK